MKTIISYAVLLAALLALCGCGADFKSKSNTSQLKAIEHEADVLERKVENTNQLIDDLAARVAELRKETSWIYELTDKLEGATNGRGEGFGDE